MEIRFELDTESLTVADMLLIEDVQDGKRPFHGMTDLMARFLADGRGQLLGEVEARKVLTSLKLTEFTGVMEAFTGAIQRKAIPPKKSAT